MRHEAQRVHQSKMLANPSSKLAWPSATDSHHCSRAYCWLDAGGIEAVPFGGGPYLPTNIPLCRAKRAAACAAVDAAVVAGGSCCGDTGGAAAGTAAAACGGTGDAAAGVAMVACSDAAACGLGRIKGGMFGGRRIDSSNACCICHTS